MEWIIIGILLIFGYWMMRAIDGMLDRQRTHDLMLHPEYWKLPSGTYRWWSPHRIRTESEGWEIVRKDGKPIVVDGKVLMRWRDDGEAGKLPEVSPMEADADSSRDQGGSHAGDRRGGSREGGV